MRSLLLFLCLCAAGAHADEPSADDVLRRVEENFRGVRDYTAQVDVKVDLERMKVPRMEATIYFKEPDRVHIAATGFAMFPREGLEFSPTRLRERYDTEGVEGDTASGVPYYEVTLRPKSDPTGLRRALLRVDARTWMPDRLTVPMFDGRTMVAQFRFTRVEGFWLPSATDVTFSSTGADTLAADIHPGVPTLRSSMPRRGLISIRYLDHRVNTGLPDSLFAQPGR